MTTAAATATRSHETKEYCKIYQRDEVYWNLVTVGDVSIIYTYFNYKQIYGAIKRMAAFWNDTLYFLKEREEIFAIWNLGRKHSIKPKMVQQENWQPCQNISDRYSSAALERKWKHKPIHKPFIRGCDIYYQNHTERFPLSGSGCACLVANE